MAKTSFTNLKIKNNIGKKVFTFNGVEIEVLQYLPVLAKDDLVAITLQQSYENGAYNMIKINMYFHLFLVYMYSNINFTEKQKENEEKIYDTLKSSGLLDEIIKQIPNNEYDFLVKKLYEQKEEYMRYNLSCAGVLNGFINKMPVGAEAAMNMVNSFDPSKFQSIIDFAQKLNGNRPI